MTNPNYPFYEPAELLDQTMLSLQELARHCATSPQWVIEHVQTGVFSYDNESSTTTVQVSSEQWRFSSQTLVRARRIAQLEHSFDALATARSGQGHAIGCLRTGSGLAVCFGNDLIAHVEFSIGRLKRVN